MWGRHAFVVVLMRYAGGRNQHTCRKHRQTISQEEVLTNRAKLVFLLIGASAESPP